MNELQFYRVLLACLTAAVATALLPAPSSPAREVFAGPVSAVVERVIDGDTIAVRARIWIDQEISLIVRVRGIDAPENRADCAAERALARRATAYLTAATQTGHVTLSEISGGKYFGRVLARVETAEGRDVAKSLLRVRLARPYQGRSRRPWC